MEAVTYTSARQNMARLLDDVCNNSEVKIITRTNKPSAVMMSLDDYNSWQETCYLLSNPCNAEHIRKSLEQADNGELVDVKLDEL